MLKGIVAGLVLIYLTEPTYEQTRELREREYRMAQYVYYKEVSKSENNRRVKKTMSTNSCKVSTQ